MKRRSAVAFCMLRSLEKIELTKGVYNMVIGSSGEISDHFNAHPFADNVSFTGSTGVGPQDH